jgi:hypothetical protein
VEKKPSLRKRVSAESSQVTKSKRTQIGAGIAAAVLAAFLAGRFTTPDGIVRRLDSKGEPILKFAGGAITSEDLAQAPRGGLSKTVIEQMGKTAFVAPEVDFGQSSERA